MMFKAARSRAFFLVVIMAVLALGVSMLSNTFASNVNYDDEKETLGNDHQYKVDLLFSKGQDPYTSMLDGTNAAVFTQNMLWSPGKTEVVYLKMINNEAFPVDAVVSLAVTDSTFGKTLTYAAIPNLTAATSAHITNWKTFESLAKQHNTTGPLTKDPEEEETLYPLSTLRSLAAGESCNIALAIHMEEEASSDYRNAQMSLRFDLQVNANYHSGETPAPTQKPE